MLKCYSAVTSGVTSGADSAAVFFLEEVFSRAIELVKEIIAQKNPELAGADSLAFVRAAVADVRQAGWQVGNVDAVASREASARMSADVGRSSLASRWENTSIGPATGTPMA